MAILNTVSVGQSYGDFACGTSQLPLESVCWWSVPRSIDYDAMPALSASLAMGRTEQIVLKSGEDFSLEMGGARNFSHIDEHAS